MRRLVLLLLVMLLAAPAIAHSGAQAMVDHPAGHAMTGHQGAPAKPSKHDRGLIHGCIGCVAAFRAPLVERVANVEPLAVPVARLVAPLIDRRWGPEPPPPRRLA